MTQQITINGFEIEYKDGGANKAGVSRWTKAGKDRLYFGDKFVDLANFDGEAELAREFTNPYGWDTKRVVRDGKKVGVRHEYRGSFVQVVKL